MQHRNPPTVGRTAHSEIAAEVRRQILSGELAPGTHLVQANLAHAMGTSITPVREALRELAVEGLVDIDAFRGAVVHTPTAAEVEELYAIRHELVPLAVRRRLATLSPADVERAATLVDEMRDSADDATWVELNRRFHRLVELDPIGSPHLTNLVRRLIDLSATYVTLTVVLESRRPEADRDHGELVAALRARDEARLIELARAHLAATLERARANFARREVV
ncbi:MAG TPA: GntR family transcriptional regulator [Gaiellaceae bacterium]|jgi:DNA-binding GntR family transcriptional regulator